MANLLHIKGSRNKILSTLPSNSMGADGDIVLSSIKGKGIYLCSKVNGKWHVSNKMEELRKIEKTSIKDLRLDRIKIGNTTITKDEYSAEGGSLAITSAHVKIDSGKNLYIDGGGDTYIREHAADSVRYIVGGDNLITMNEQGDDGNQVYFNNASAGFQQLEPTYDATDTLVDFRHSNKQFVTFGAGNITNLNLYFPAMSGNFVVLLKQDNSGSRTITNYKVREFDESLADGESAVKFAGGSNPTLTTDANHVDILSFYWDNDSECAYGVATLDFQD